jgi:hypothetical protein
MQSTINHIENGRQWCLFVLADISQDPILEDVRNFQEIWSMILDTLLQFLNIIVHIYIYNKMDTRYHFSHYQEMVFFATPYWLSIAYV